MTDFALIDGSTAIPLRGQPFQIGDVQYPGNVIHLWTDEELASIGVVRVPEPSTAPEGQVETSRSLVLVEGSPVWSVTYGPKPVPTKIHKIYVIRVLETWGLMDTVEAAMDAAWAAGSKSFKRYWDAASEIYRNDPILAAFASSLNWTDEQLDQLFVQGAAYQAAVVG